MIYKTLRQIDSPTLYYKRVVGTYPTEPNWSSNWPCLDSVVVALEAVDGDGDAVHLADDVAVVRLPLRVGLREGAAHPVRVAGTGLGLAPQERRVPEKYT